MIFWNVFFKQKQSGSSRGFFFSWSPLDLMESELTLIIYSAAFLFITGICNLSQAPLICPKLSKSPELSELAGISTKMPYLRTKQTYWKNNYQTIKNLSMKTTKRCLANACVCIGTQKRWRITTSFWLTYIIYTYIYFGMAGWNQQISVSLVSASNLPELS